MKLIQLKDVPYPSQKGTEKLLQSSWIMRQKKKKGSLWLDVRVGRQKPEFPITLGTHHTSHGLLIVSLLSHLNHVVLGFSVVFRET